MAIGESARGTACCVMVPHGNLGSNCHRHPTTLINGMYYCKYHQPERERERSKKRQEEYEKDRENWQERHDRDMLILGIFGDIPTTLIKKYEKGIKEYFGKLMDKGLTLQ